MKLPITGWPRFVSTQSHLRSKRPVSDNNFYQRMTDAVVNGEVAEASRIAQETLNAGLNALDVIKQGVVGGTDKLGDLFQNFEIFLPELIMGGDAARGAMASRVTHVPLP